ncbi:MAG TPA: hypothetical protein VK527_02095 [Candidatus Limnocylindrales bacterium]|nr:hypothetical protein [Candidatus Limnocylindrales bacterium]
MNGEALFIGGYVAALLLTAMAMDWAARASHERIHRTKTIGFRYHSHLNAWQCSEGTLLWHQETDAVARVVRFHAKAEICNACSLKSVCTDSDEGRTLVRPLDDWPHSEMARFQRVISLSLMVLAVLLCCVEIARQSDAPVKVAFGASAFLSVALAVREWKRVRTVRTAWS